MTPHIVPSIPVPTQSRPLDRDQTRGRVFIGPVPEKVISQAEGHIKKRCLSCHSGNPESDSASQLIEPHAFVLRGRRGAEGSGENERSPVQDHWKSREWVSVWARRMRKDLPSRETSRWVGGSFEVGQFLDANIFQDSKKRSSHGGGTLSQNPHSAPSHSVASTSCLKSGEVSEMGGSNTGSVRASSSTSLLKRTSEQRRPSGLKARATSTLRPPFKMPSLSMLSGGITSSDRKGKARLVGHEDTATEGQEVHPVLHPEALEMTGNNMEDTSTAEPPIDDVIMRDRMLVRSCYTKSVSVRSLFNEVLNRTTPHLEDANWAEYMVVWRRDRIELYNDHSIPGKEWFVGHKKLAFVIPLKSSGTHLSLYSFVDLTFCLTCLPTTPRGDLSKTRWFFFGEGEGTNIFIFKLKSRSRAYDWFWRLWRQLGGELPRTIEVSNSRLGAKVKIDVPAMADDEIYAVFGRENVIAQCMNSLRSTPQWSSLVEREIMEGKSLELAWRVGTNLDWIWLDEDVQGKPRPWAVLCGLALKQSKAPAVLEIRLAEHFPRYVRLTDGSRLREPHAVEGYLERIKPTTQERQGLYISTHDGNMFVLPPYHAHPPLPPVFATDVVDSEGYMQTLQSTEMQRGAKQILHATGACDLRNILLIRRASHPIPQPTHNERSENDDDAWFRIWSQSEIMTQNDEEDVGGEEGLSRCEDRPRLRTQRSFELLLTTGHVIRFEAHSCGVAIEWIERLRTLVLYWKQRHRIDAKEEMDLAQTQRSRLTPLRRVVQDHDYAPEAPPNPSASLPALGFLYNWCVLEGCKPIIKGGKIYMRKGLYGQYRLIQLFLVAGHLSRFRITPASSLHTMHKKTNLFDAYVCSGYLAALALPHGQYNATAKVAPRRYQDGLETDDREEDNLFMVWYRNQGPLVLQPLSDLPSPVPALSAKRKVLVFRTRSKLERDAWCWAINCEIDKIVRIQMGREERIRNTGNLKT